MLLRRVKQTKGIKGKGITLEYVRGEKVTDNRGWDTPVASENIFEKIRKNGYIQVSKLG